MVCLTFYLGRRKTSHKKKRKKCFLFLSFSFGKGAVFFVFFFFFNYLLELRALLHFRVFFTKNMIQKDNEDDDIGFYFLIDSK